MRDGFAVAATVLIALGLFALVLMARDVATSAGVGKVDASYAVILVEAPQPARTANMTHRARLEASVAICGQSCVVPAFLSKPAPSELKVNRSTLASRFVPWRGDCQAVFSADAQTVFDAPAPDWPPPLQIPAELFNAYMLNGLVQNYSVPPMFQKYAGAAAMQPVWKRDAIEQRVRSFAQLPSGTYGSTAGRIVFDALQSAKADVVGKRVLVVGSEQPWVEVAALASGARNVVTLEYGRIVSEHAQIQTFVVPDFIAAQRAGTLGEFDVAMSFSSLEHAGLGRYGDLLNPWADVVSVARMRCVLRKGGLLILGLPTLNTGDSLFYNQHRSYGLVRWPLVLQGFRVEQEVRYDKYRHGLVVARKTDD